MMKTTRAFRLPSILCLSACLWCAIAAEEPTNATAQPADEDEVIQTPEPTDGAGARWEQAARQGRAAAEGITWFTHEPMEFLARRGDHYNDDPERYARMNDPENIRHMGRAGVKYGLIYFYKGFGLEYERENMEQAKRTVKLMHENGMKVGIYIGGTMFTETLYREQPKAQDWEQRNQDNHWVPYGIQTFRHYACPNEPAYRDYIKRVLKIAVEDVHADQILFDNLMLQPEPDSCRCPRCIRAFHDFLRRKYPTKEAVKRRFGLPDVDWIKVNEWSTAAQPDKLAALNDPVLQEWVRFRCESLANYADDLSSYIKHLNPKVSVLMNIKGMFSYNRYWLNAVYHPLFAGHVDVIAFDTGGYYAQLDPDTSAMVSQIRSYKMARMLGASCNAPLNRDLWAAQHMAFGYETDVPGYPGAPAMSYNVHTPIVEFFRHYLGRYYTGTTNVADVAVLHNWPSMAYSINAAYVPVTLLEQVLIEYKVPFDILFDEQLDRLDRYREVILAGQECVSDEQVELLMKYVRNGGTLVVAGNTGTYNGWRERRRVNPFLPARQEGRGHILYIRDITRADNPSRRRSGDEDAEPGASSRATARLTPREWLPPKNSEEIYKTVLSGLPQGLSIDTGAPLTTVMELVTRPETRETIAHFVNFDAERPVTPFKVTVRKQYAGKVKSVACFSPETDDPVPLKFEESGDRVTFTAPGLKVYSMIVVAQE